MIIRRTNWGMSTAHCFLIPAGSLKPPSNDITNLFHIHHAHGDLVLQLTATWLGITDTWISHCLFLNSYVIPHGWSTGIPAALPNCSYVIILRILHASSRGHAIADGWGTMLQAGRSRVRVPIRSLEFFNSPNSSSPGVYSASNRNVYQKIFLGVKCVRRVGLTTNLHVWAKPTV
jgi:hypothetical protein